MYAVVSASAQRSPGRVLMTEGRKRIGPGGIPSGGNGHVGARRHRRDGGRNGRMTRSGGGREHGLHRTMPVGAPSTELTEIDPFPFLPRDRGLASTRMGDGESTAAVGSTRRSERENGATRVLPIPASGRVFRRERRVRLGDVDSSGRLRFDAVARYLQDVATDDSDDLGSLEARAWVVRRTLIEQRHALRNSEDVSLATFCSGMGNRWAERRVSMTGASGGSVEAVTLWVHLDPLTGRPKTLPEDFVATYSEPSGGREVTARQLHEPVIPGDDDVHTMPWWPRVRDIDVLNHVNNAVAWEVVEQTLERVRARELLALELLGSVRAEVEFRDPIEYEVVVAAMPLTIAYRVRDEILDIALWSTDGEAVYITARVRSLE